MVLEGFRKTNIRKNIKKELLKDNSKIVDANQKVKSILILVDVDTQENLDQIISRRFNIEVSEITSLCYKMKQESNNNFELELTEKDFSLLGKLKKDEMKKLVETEFDLLLNYTNDNLPLNYITTFSKAKFKVGLSNDQQELFDLMIEVDSNNVELFHDELEKYLKILNKI